AGIAAQRTRAWEALRASEARLRQVLAAARMGIGEWDFQARQATLSDEFLHLAGLERLDFGNGIESFFSLVHPEDRPAVENGMRVALTDPGDEGQFSIEFR